MRDRRIIENRKCIMVFHQGWTDIVMCIGLIFFNLRKYHKIVLIMASGRKDFIEFIFRNHKNIIIEYSPKVNRNSIWQIRSKYRSYKYLPYGHCFCPPIKSNRAIGGSAEYFYQYFCKESVDPTESVNSFHIDRDLLLEDMVYHKIRNEIGEKYIILNEDIQRNLIIDRNKLPPNIPTYNLNGNSQVAWDLITTIENAEEIHIISTFWSLIIYNLQKKYNLFQNIPIYYHSYVRNGYNDPFYKDSNWIFLHD